MVFIKYKTKGIRAAAASHIGKRRQNNEDNMCFDGYRMETDNAGTGTILTCETNPLDAITGKDAFFAVFDGMGGGDYGEIASFTAADEARVFFKELHQVDIHDVSLSLQEFCLKANEEVFVSGRNLGSDRMGTTIVGCYFLDGRVWVCNVGDSRCFRYRSGFLQQLSCDHTDEEYMRENGITDRKPYLTQYLGVDPEEMYIEPFIKSFTVAPGDLYLLCSDGLTDMVEEDEIKRILAGPEMLKNKVNALISAALSGGGRDNITVILCEN